MSTGMEERRVAICNPMGIHARAAAQFASLSSKFESEILVRFRDMEVDGKSIMGVMMLAAALDSELLITAIGIDADAAVMELASLVQSGFGEIVEIQ